MIPSRAGDLDILNHSTPSIVHDFMAESGVAYIDDCGISGGYKSDLRTDLEGVHEVGGPRTRFPRDF